MKNSKKLNFKNQMLAELDDYLTDLLENDNDSDSKKVEKLSYWIKDWISYLKREKNFNPNKLQRYKRGSIVKVHLGFNVGSEEGGLHYAIVIDADNKKANPLITVIPLTSVKTHKDISKLPKDQLYIGDEVYRLTVQKLEKLLKELSDVNLEEASEEDIENLRNDLEYAKRVRKETDKMKTGSIALVGQLTTISKLRIYDPKNKYGVLKGLRVSDDILEQLDTKLKENYFKKF